MDRVHHTRNGPAPIGPYIYPSGSDRGRGGPGFGCHPATGTIARLWGQRCWKLPILRQVTGGSMRNEANDSREPAWVLLCGGGFASKDHPQTCGGGGPNLQWASPGAQKIPDSSVGYLEKKMSRRLNVCDQQGSLDASRYYYYIQRGFSRTMEASSLIYFHMACLMLTLSKTTTPPYTLHQIHKAPLISPRCDPLLYALNTHDKDFTGRLAWRREIIPTRTS